MSHKLTRIRQFSSKAKFNRSTQSTKSKIEKSTRKELKLNKDRELKKLQKDLARGDEEYKQLLFQQSRGVCADMEIYQEKTLLVASILTNILLLNTEKAFRYTNDYLDDINGRKSEVPVFIRGRTKPNRGTLNRLIRNELPTIHTKCLKKLKEKKKTRNVANIIKNVRGSIPTGKTIASKASSRFTKGTQPADAAYGWQWPV